jgi:hypothetical protein
MKNKNKDKLTKSLIFGSIILLSLVAAYISYDANPGYSAIMLVLAISTLIIGL